MNKTDLTTYLNDHHAGSLGALEMIDHLIEIFKRSQEIGGNKKIDN